jgi:hypothetical protein
MAVAAQRFYEWRADPIGPRRSSGFIPGIVLKWSCFLRCRIIHAGGGAPHPGTGANNIKNRYFRLLRSAHYVKVNGLR